MIRHFKLPVLAMGVMVFAIACVMGCSGKKDKSKEVRIQPVHGTIRSSVITTGMVEPQNRLEIKPPVGGRVEEVRKQEGDQVAVGDVLALISSTERASLLDAARLQDAKTLDYWQNVYKPIPLVSPIVGQVIVRSVEPGQTLTASDTVIVLSDRLIVTAQVDETDIGNIKVGQKAIVTLDAYPDIQVKGEVSHISYESKVTNNVTIYDVDIIPETVPDVFRSGMSANVEIVREEVENALLVPQYVLSGDKVAGFTVDVDRNGRAVKQDVTVGIVDNENVQILTGLTDADTVIWKKKVISKEARGAGKSPFMPQRAGRK